MAGAVARRRGDGGMAGLQVGVRHGLPCRLPAPQAQRRRRRPRRHSNRRDHRPRAGRFAGSNSNRHRMPSRESLRILLDAWVPMLAWAVSHALVPAVIGR